jgi:hypothetical protein
MSRRPLTREMLLPFAPPQVRALSLSSHLALLALEKGEGNWDHMVVLAGVICRTSLMGDPSGIDTDKPLLEAADLVMRRLMDGADPDRRWSVGAEDGAVLARVLAIHDQMVATLPRRRYFEAQARMEREANAVPREVWDGLPAWCQPPARV